MTPSSSRSSSPWSPRRRAIAVVVTLAALVALVPALARLTDGDGQDRARGSATLSADRRARTRLPSCPAFRSSDVRHGRMPRRDALCWPAYVAAGVVHAPLGPRAHARDRRNYHRPSHGRRRHTGTDFLARCGAKVHAVQSGKVVVGGGTRRSGKFVGVTSGPRRLTTWYAHLSRIGVRDRQRVEAGQVIGRVGRSGHPRRCMLHLAVSRRTGAADGDPANPSRWLALNVGQQLSGLPPSRPSERLFTVASFNVLGASHVRRSRQWAGTRTRTRLLVQLLRSNGVTVAGLQELEDEQAARFRAEVGRTWGIYSPQGDTRDSIVWKRSRFRVVKRRTITVPYKRNERPMPVVLLQDRASGRRTYVISVHNVVGEKPRWVARRNEALRRELAAVKRIRRSTGLPVIILGDFNERDRSFFCTMRRHGLVAAIGGRGGRYCAPPIAAGIDWIFRTSGARFAGFQRFGGGLVAKASDHSFLVARVRR